MTEINKNFNPFIFLHVWIIWSVWFWSYHSNVGVIAKRFLVYFRVRGRKNYWKLNSMVLMIGMRHKKGYFSLLHSAWNAEEGMAMSEFAVGEKEKAGLMFFKSEEGSLRNAIKSSVLWTIAERVQSSRSRDRVRGFSWRMKNGSRQQVEDQGWSQELDTVIGTDLW